MHCIGRSNCNGYGNRRWIHHDLFSLNAVILPNKLPNLKIRLRSRVRKCCPHATAKPESYVGNRRTEWNCIQRVALAMDDMAKLALRRCTEGEASDVVRLKRRLFANEKNRPRGTKNTTVAIER